MDTYYPHLAAPKAEPKPETLVDASTVAGLGYNPFRSIKTHPDDPNVQAIEHAKHFIGVLEQALAKKGFSTLMAAEQEMDVEFRDAFGVFDQRQAAIQLVKQLNQVRDAQKATEWGSDIEKAYLDEGIDHYIFEVCMAPARPDVAAQRLTERQKVMGNVPRSKEVLYQASFAPVACNLHAHNELNYGQHMNMSLHEGADLSDREMLAGERNITSDSSLGDLLMQVLARRGASDLLLLYNSQASFDRWKYRQRHAPVWFKCTSHHKDDAGQPLPEREDRDKTRVENCMPDAACNPYLNVLTSLAAMYFTICAAERAGDPIVAGAKKNAAQIEDINESYNASAPMHIADMSFKSIKQKFEECSLTFEALTDAIDQLGLGEAETQRLSEFKQAAIARADQLHAASKQFARAI